MYSDGSSIKFGNGWKKYGKVQSWSRHHPYTISWEISWMLMQPSCQGKKRYPLVNKHSYWKWPSRNSGFTHFHSMVDLSIVFWDCLPEGYVIQSSNHLSFSKWIFPVSNEFMMANIHQLSWLIFPASNALMVDFSLANSPKNDGKIHHFEWDNSLFYGHFQ